MQHLCKSHPVQKFGGGSMGTSPQGSRMFFNTANLLLNDAINKGGGECSVKPIPVCLMCMCVSVNLCLCVHGM